MSLGAQSQTARHATAEAKSIYKTCNCESKVKLQDMPLRRQKSNCKIYYCEGKVKLQDMQLWGKGRTTRHVTAGAKSNYKIYYCGGKVKLQYICYYVTKMSIYKTCTSEGKVRLQYIPIPSAFIILTRIYINFKCCYQESTRLDWSLKFWLL